MGSQAPATAQHEFTGVFNLRDLGGITAYQGTAIAEGMLFRADGLHRIPVEERARLTDLGITEVIDLRTEEEGTREGRYEHDSVIVHRVPIIEELSHILQSAESGGVESGDLLLQQYLTMSRNNGDAFATALRLIADAVKNGRPLVYHCTAGKDRTGVLTALILSGLGVDDEIVATDYARSAPAAQKMVAWYRANSTMSPEARMAEMGLDPDLVNSVLAADPSTMVKYLARMRTEHGHVTDYLVKIDAVASIARIGRALLRPV